jgi:hypothetical protein
MKRFAPVFLIAMFGLASLSCMAVNRTLFGEPPTSTPVPPTLTSTPLPTSTRFLPKWRLYHRLCGSDAQPSPIKRRWRGIQDNAPVFSGP